MVEIAEKNTADSTVTLPRPGDAKKIKKINKSCKEKKCGTIPVRFEKDYYVELKYTWTKLRKRQIIFLS